MKVLVVGQGSCEHALIKKLKQSDICDEIFCIKGNAGIAQDATCVDIAPSNAAALAEFAIQNQIGLTITCSHVPIQNNIARVFENYGLKILAPHPEALRFLMHPDKIRPVCAEAGIKYFPSEEGQKLLVCLADGKSIVPMPLCRAYYKMYDNNEGPKTSGMGAYISSDGEDELSNRVYTEILLPLSRRLLREGVSFCGLISVKFSISEGEIILNGFDTHISGSIVAVLMEKLQSDLMDIFIKCTNGMLRASSFSWNRLCAVSVVMASALNVQKSDEKREKPIITLKESSKAKVLHSRTITDENGNLRASGGRVLCICASAKSLEAARDIAYSTISHITFDGMYYRSDIARRVVEK